MENHHFVSFDIETTGLNPLDHRIIEIGAVKFTLGQGIIDTFSSFVAYDGVIPKGVIKIHGITSEMLIGAPPIGQILEQFVEFIGEGGLIAHNASFDASFIGYQLGHHQLEYPKNQIFDTLLLSRKLLPTAKSHSLSNLKKQFNILVDKEHRALDDAKAAMELFNILIKDWTRPSVKYLSNLIQMNPPVHFYEFTLASFNKHQEKVKSINQAIEKKDKLLISYSDKQKHQSERFVLPSAILLNNGYLYLVGYCLLRQEERRFRLDRITHIETQPGASAWMLYK